VHSRQQHTSLGVHPGKFILQIFYKGGLIEYPDMQKIIYIHQTN